MKYDADGYVIDWLTMSGGTVKVKGLSADGKEYSLTGDVEQVGVVRKEPDENYMYSIKTIPTDSTDYYLKFKIKENGEAYRVQVEPLEEASNDAETEDTVSDYSKGFDAGWSEGFEHAKAEALTAAVKGLMNL